MGRILVEICCGSLDDALAAKRGGADRIELCSALSVGGLTPSAGTVALARSSVELPIVVLVRPRAGGFCYSAPEYRVMEADIDYALEQGADGVVFGVLKEDGWVDRTRCRELRRRAGDRQVVFHRAFDVTPDPFRALEELIDLGFTRILTSGGQSRAVDGMPLIRDLVERAEGRIEILPGSGITPENALHVVESTGCTQIHASASSFVRDASVSAGLSLGFGEIPGGAEGEYRATDSGIVRRLVELTRQ